MANISDSSCPPLGAVFFSMAMATGSKFTAEYFSVSTQAEGHREFV
jgi:hypothetical protein